MQQNLNWYLGAKYLLPQMLSANTATTDTAPTDVSYQGHQYRRINVTKTYRAHNHRAERTVKGSLMDRGANGGIVGKGAKITTRHLIETVDVVGVGPEKHEGLSLCTAMAKVKTMKGIWVIAIMHQYADGQQIGLDRTIHSATQTEAHHHLVDEKSRSEPVFGRQMMVTSDGHMIPIKIRDGLPYMDFVEPTEKEMRELPSFTMTSDDDWDPTILDNEYEPEDFPNNDEEFSNVYVDPRVNMYGDIDFDRIINTADIDKQEAEFEQMVDLAILEARFCHEMNDETDSENRTLDLKKSDNGLGRFAPQLCILTSRDG
jgi:hypothetical protein